MAKEIGSPSRNIDDVLLRADIRDFVETYYGVPLEKLKVGSMLMDLVAILSNHGLRLPSDLLLLIRAFVTLEGLGRSLDPTFNMAAEIAPFVEQLVKERYSPRRMFDRAAGDVKSLLGAAHAMPLQLTEILAKLSDDDLKLQFEHRGLDHLINEFDRSSNRVVVGVITAALILASALVVRAGATSPWITVPPFLLSGFLGVLLIYGILRSGRL